MNKYATEEWVSAQIQRGVSPLPDVTVYEKPTNIPLENGSQIVFYASTGGDMSFTLGNKTYVHHLADMNEVGWCLWIQTQETSGSFIFPNGTRYYFNQCGAINEANLNWSPSEIKDTYNYIVIVIN